MVYSYLKQEIFANRAFLISLLTICKDSMMYKGR